MKKDESLNDLQTRFTHVINNLNALGRVIDNEQQINKVMRCLTREWQPKVTVIAESKDLGSMTIATLFGKLREHEMELHRLNESEKTYRKRKGLSLKAQTHKPKSEPETCTDDSESETDEEPEIGMLATLDLNVFNCKIETKDEEANLCLMANVDSDSNRDVSTTSNHSYEELHDAFNELHDEHIKYGDNNKGKILGAGDIGSESTTIIKDVLYVKGLKHNLLSISQLCDKGYQVYFTSHTCTLEHKEDDSLKLIGCGIRE
ncbi:uncharacterized protein [Cicer arietinum]|uniref:uncharacterized protein n=1 Tax=Cicer arietinum TaxID=3827 RepID=UPI00032A52E8